ncbi:MAG: sulfur reduction protein DsrE [Acidobacteria bacterium]|jgi:tRNA 2-thiouridine synthesizing protein C|nr:MAG: sulfur reduction protein DsrE [Acidobacteriota bacterium]
MKRVAFIIKGDPFSWKSHEALRVAMALGISCEVHLIFIKDGVYLLSKWNPEALGITGFEKLLDNLEYVNLKLYAEDASLEERGLKREDLLKPVELRSMDEIRELISHSEGVFVW